MPKQPESWPQTDRIDPIEFLERALAKLVRHELLELVPRASQEDTLRSLLPLLRLPFSAGQLADCLLELEQVEDLFYAEEEEIEVLLRQVHQSMDPLHGAEDGSRDRVILTLHGVATERFEFTFPDQGEGPHAVGEVLWKQRSLTLSYRGPEALERFLAEGLFLARGSFPRELPDTSAQRAFSPARGKSNFNQLHILQPPSDWDAYGISCDPQGQPDLEDFEIFYALQDQALCTKQSLQLDFHPPELSAEQQSSAFRLRLDMPSLQTDSGPLSQDFSTLAGALEAVLGAQLEEGRIRSNLVRALGSSEASLREQGLALWKLLKHPEGSSPELLEGARAQAESLLPPLRVPELLWTVEGEPHAHPGSTGGRALGPGVWLDGDRGQVWAASLTVDLRSGDLLHRWAKEKPFRRSVVRPDCWTNSPAPGPEDSILVGSAEQLLCLDPDGFELRWSAEVGSLESPALWPAGSERIYLGAGGFYLKDEEGQRINGALRAVSVEDGSLLWSTTTRGSLDSSPTLTDRGLLLAQCQDGVLYAVDAETGAIQWTLEGKLSTSTVTLSEDQSLAFLGRGDGQLQAVEVETGAVVWSLDLGTRGLYGVSAQPILGPDGSLYVGSQAALVWAVDSRTGEARWRYELPGSSSKVVAAGVLSEEGVFYVGSHDQHIYALDAASGELIWRFPVGGSILSPPVLSPEGLLLIADSENRLVALQLPES